jgi:hypothetical protein
MQNQFRLAEELKKDKQSSESGGSSHNANNVPQPPNNNEEDYKFISDHIGRIHPTKRIWKLRDGENNYYKAKEFQKLNEPENISEKNSQNKFSQNSSDSHSNGSKGDCQLDAPKDIQGSRGDGRLRLRQKKTLKYDFDLDSS